MYLTSSSISKEELEEKKVENKYIFISSKIKKNHVIIKIKDNAHGIENSALPHIFEPYFTTKKYKKSSGLGLFLSKIIIEENMQGKLEFENASEGAKFVITLPISKENE